LQDSGPAFDKAILFRTKVGICKKEIHNMVSDYGFHQLTNNTC